MHPVVKCLLPLCALGLVTVLLLYSEDGENYSEDGSVVSSRTQNRDNASFNSSNSDTAAGTAINALTKEKQQLLWSLSLSELEELLTMVRRPAPRPQTGIGRRSAPAQPDPVLPEVVEATLNKLKVHLLEEVANAKYETLLDAAVQGRPVSQQSWSRPVKVAIVTTWRSGSTFLEQLLVSHPAMFDFYEPLLMYDLKRVRNGTDAVEAQNILRNIFKCRYQNDNYYKIIKKLRDMMERNFDYFKICKSEGMKIDTCYDLQLLSTSCKLFPWTLIKLVRLKLELMRPFLEDRNIGSNLQIIFLVRDPRAVVNSRRSTVGWCKPSSQDCYSPEVLCKDMEEDLETANNFKKLFPGHVHILRYEDMARDPFNVTAKLLKDIGLNFTDNMKEFLVAHTTHEVDKPWSTSRNSKERIMYWTHKMPFEQVLEVQKVCSSAMFKFGYIPIMSLEQLTADDILKQYSEGLQTNFIR